MKNIKIKATKYDLVISSKKEENEEKSYEKGYEVVVKNEDITTHWSNF